MNRKQKAVYTLTKGVRWEPANAPVWIDPSDLSTMRQDLGGASAVAPASVGAVVGSIRNKGTLGGWLQAPSNTSRPILRQSGSLYYLEFDGVDDNIRSDAGFFNSPVIHAFVGFLATGTAGKSVIGYPHAPTTHVSPWWRWDWYTASALALTSTINAVATAFLPYPLSTAVVGDQLSSDGKLYANGALQGTATPAAAITWPNAVPLIVGANVVSGEALNGRIYGIVMYGGAQNDVTTARARRYLARKVGVSV